MNQVVNSKVPNSRPVPQMGSSLKSPFRNTRGEAEYMAAYDATMRLWRVPYEQMAIWSRFGSTHVVICGPRDAPPLVLLHCFATSLSSWAYNIAALSQNRRVFALDMMGQAGKSIPDQPIKDRGALAEWLTDTFDQLGIRRTDLIGYSFGGFASLNYAIHAPDRVQKLVLLSPAGGLVPLWKQFYVRGIVSTALPGLSNLLAKPLWFDWFFYRPNLSSEQTRRLYDRLLAQFALGQRYFRTTAGVLPVAYNDDELRMVRSSTLVLIGRQEALYDPVAAVRRAKQLIPDVQTALIQQASHDLPISQAETVNERVLAFLETEGGMFGTDGLGRQGAAKQTPTAAGS